MSNLCDKNYMSICNNIFNQINCINYRSDIRKRKYIFDTTRIKHYDYSLKGRREREMIDIVGKLTSLIKASVKKPYLYRLNTRQKSTSSIIPYDKIDKEMIEVIRLLNEKGFKTRFCCWGHNPHESVFIVFDKSINEQDMAKLFYKLKDYYYKAYKWMRYCEPKDDVWSNWVLEYPAHNVPKDEEKYDEVKIECHNKLINILREM